MYLCPKHMHIKIIGYISYPSNMVLYSLTYHFFCLIYICSKLYPEDSQLLKLSTQIPRWKHTRILCPDSQGVQSYTLEEIKEKHLCLLIPFLPIRFRRSIPSDAKIQSASSPDEHRSLEKRLQKSKEELTSFFTETILILD